MPLSDEHLIKRAIDGSHVAFAMLVERHRDVVTRLVAEISRSGVDLEDIVQECFIRAYRGLRTYRADASFSTWLLRIAYNVAITRSSQHVRRNELVEPNSERVSYAADTDTPNPDDEVVNHEIECRMASLIDQLSEHYRVALILYYYEELTYQEIADVLGKPLNTVKAHLNRAKAQLRRLLVADSMFEEWES